MRTVRQIRVEHSPVVAEVIPNIHATWHIARCIPGSEQTTALHLCARRFGVYVPLEDTWDRQHVIKQTPLFPGYLFVFLWGLPEHLKRVKDCPGVCGFLLEGPGTPVTVPDPIMKQLQTLEWKHYLKHLPRSFFRRRHRNESWIIPQWSLRNYGFANPTPNSPDTPSLARALQLSTSS